MDSLSPPQFDPRMNLAWPVLRLGRHAHRGPKESVVLPFTFYPRILVLWGRVRRWVPSTTAPCFSRQPECKSGCGCTIDKRVGLPLGRQEADPPAPAALRTCAGDQSSCKLSTKPGTKSTRSGARRVSRGSSRCPEPASVSFVLLKTGRTKLVQRDAPSFFSIAEVWAFTEAAHKAWTQNTPQGP